MMRRIIGRYHRMYLDQKTSLDQGTGSHTIPLTFLSLKPGNEVNLGEAEIRYSDDGMVRACDAHGCLSALTDKETPVYIKPIPGIYRLQRFSPFIYIEFETSLYTTDKSFYWVLAPIDLEVYIGSSLLGVLSPTKVKYTLIGDILDGIVCRYFKASVKRMFSPKPSENLTAGALGFHVKTKSGSLIPGIGFNALRSPLYANKDGLIFYPLIEVEIENSKLVARVQEKPPLKNLMQIYKPKHTALAMVQQLQPFTMQL